MSNPTYFVMVYDETDDEITERYSRIRQGFQSLASSGRTTALRELEMRPKQVGFVDWNCFPQSMRFKCLALDTKSAEKVRDMLKWVLRKVKKYPVPCSRKREVPTEYAIRKSLETLSSRLSGFRSNSHNTGIVRGWRLRDFGLFVPGTVRKYKDVRTHSFDHGGGHFYRYRTMQSKLKVLMSDQFQPLGSYLNSLYTDCPNHFFKSGPRISALNWPIKARTAELVCHELSMHARQALSQRRYKTQHDSVEVHLLENDACAVATEIPVWVEPTEMMEQSMLFSTTECLTGHIDILRINRGRIEIWDYKSTVSNNISADLQVLLYAIALSIRTGIQLTHFGCGYFDSDRAYYFTPANIDLQRTSG